MQETTIPENCGSRRRYRADFKQLVPRRRLRRQDCLKAPTGSKYNLDTACVAIAQCVLSHLSTDTFLESWIPCHWNMVQMILLKSIWRHGFIFLHIFRWLTKALSLKTTSFVKWRKQELKGLLCVAPAGSLVLYYKCDITAGGRVVLNQQPYGNGLGCPSL